VEADSRCDQEAHEPQPAAIGVKPFATGAQEPSDPLEVVGQ
jgi:hypothetical protein